MGRFDAVIRRAFLGAALVWAAAILLAPALTKAASAPADGLGLVIYMTGSVICHQRPERSFQLLGVQMPVCARCTGIYVGAALAALAALAPLMFRRLRSPADSVPERRWPGWAIALISAAPALATLVYEWTTGVMPSNAVRAASGVPMGAVVSWLVLRPFDAAQGRLFDVAQGRVN